jgi:hypothetical protein
LKLGMHCILAFKMTVVRHRHDQATSHSDDLSDIPSVDELAGMSGVLN